VHAEYAEELPEAIVSAAHSFLHVFGIGIKLLLRANSSIRIQVQNAFLCTDDVEIKFIFPTSKAR
jgi:hypothetical protein